MCLSGTVLIALLCVGMSCGVGSAAETGGPRAISLRGSAVGQGDSVPTEASEFWTTLGENRVADEEGEGLITVHGDLELCQQICVNYRRCRSFAFCSGVCYLKGGEISADSPSHANEVCTTYFRGASPAATTTAAPPAGGPSACYPLQAALQMNQAQQYPGNPYAEATGSVRLLLCTNGTLLGNLSVENGSSRIIATHIHHCQGGDSPQTRSGVLCGGPPVLNFCGDNRPGLIADGADYTAPCADFNRDGMSRTAGMQGALLPGGPMTLAERVRDIGAHPDKYYFNVHSMASYNHFYPHHEGMVRGPLEGRSVETTTTTPAPPAAAKVENRCVPLFSQMSMNELQRYPNNPDSTASGYVDMLLCTNGTLRATGLLFGGASKIIAMHIHHCQGGATPQTRTGDLCSGPPVINFCGDSSHGLIADGANYPEGCARWSAAGSSRTENMQGIAIQASGSEAVARLVEDIAENPNFYYFNVHTEGSYMHWYPDHNGMCRGPLQLS